MRRSVALLFVAMALLLAWPVTPAMAADDDMPGVPLAVGGSVSGSVGSADPLDVYSVDLTAGEEVYIRFDPGNTVGPTGVIHLFVPGAVSVADSESFSEINLEAQGGVPWESKHGAYFHYIPAKTGTYYLCAEWTAGALDYQLSVVRSSRAPLALVADADDLPGTPLSDGTFTGVVSTLGDRDDVYAVVLTAGRTCTIELAPLTPFDDWDPAKGHVVPYKARVSLLGSTVGSVAQAPSHTLAGSSEAANTRDHTQGQSATIQYTPTTSGIYYVYVEAGPFVSPDDRENYYGMDFPYLLTVAGASASSGSGGSFPDVSGSPYATAILDLSDRGVIAGFQDGTFRPDATVTRQQFAKMIVKTLGYAVTGSEVCPFSDVATQVGSDPFYPSKYVAVCAQRGITAGKTATTFAPGDDITRQQLITMVARAAALPAPPGSYSAPFGAAQFSLQEHFVNARKAAYAGLLNGLQGVGPSYGFGAASTRGECAQLLYNLLTSASSG